MVGGNQGDTEMKPQIQESKQDVDDEEMKDVNQSEVFSTDGSNALK